MTVKDRSFCKFLEEAYVSVTNGELCWIDPHLPYTRYNTRHSSMFRRVTFSNTSSVPAVPGLCVKWSSVTVVISFVTISWCLFPKESGHVPHLWPARGMSITHHERMSVPRFRINLCIFNFREAGTLTWQLWRLMECLYIGGHHYFWIVLYYLTLSIV